jgi:EAL domain-containing protein (putative c-di-GMP-specific phosphodiesterase class I)
MVFTRLCRWGRNSPSHTDYVTAISNWPVRHDGRHVSGSSRLRVPCRILSKWRRSLVARPRQSKWNASEIGSSELLESLTNLRDLIPDADIVLETHESAVKSAAGIKVLRAALSDLNIALPYDNFGASEARLIELVEVPPDFITLDMSMIRDIDNAPVARQKMLETVVSMVNNLGIICIAKGLETAGEMRICRELGFDYGQGYLIGRPAPVHGWLRPMSGDSEASIFNNA